MNALTNCTVDEVLMLQPDLVRFKISLERHTHLRHYPEVYFAMTEYAARYHPRVYGWQIEAQGEWLYIYVQGRVNPDIAAQFM